MPFTFIRQPDSMDCGPTCLQMIAKHYGRDHSLQALREKAQKGKDGVNMLGLIEGAESIGFRTQAIRLSYTELKDNALLPCILHWDQRHFVVLYRVRKGKLFVADPGSGLVSLTGNEFQRRWLSSKDDNEIGEGIALLLEPTREFYTYSKDMEGLSEKKGGRGSLLAFKKIIQYILPYKSSVFQLFLGLVVTSILQLIIPFLTQSVVDVGVNTANVHFVYVVLLAQIALTIGRLSVDFVRSWLLLHISTRINISILTDFLIKLMSLPLSFFDSRKTGDILQRMNDHQRIESFLTGSSINVIFSIANLLIFSVVLAIFNGYIFLVFIIASVLYSIWVFLFLKKRKALDYKRFEIASREQSITIQLIQGMQEIKLNSVEKQMRWSWERMQAKLFQVNMRGLALNKWQQSGATFINEAKNILITLLSATAVIDGQMTLGTMLAVQYIIGQLNSPIEEMIGFAQSWQNAKISMDRLNEIHGMEDEEPAHEHLLQHLPAAFVKQIEGGRSVIQDDGARMGGDRVRMGGVESRMGDDGVRIESRKENDGSWIGDNESRKKGDGIRSGSDGIRFSNVSFTYPGAGNEPVLRDINLNIPKGRTTAVVGVSGSGKTTLLKLLLKFYEPQKGDIRLWDTSLSRISHKAWRDQCGAVMQESFIFSDSIVNNIAVGVERVDMDKVQQAVKIANIEEFIEGLPFGLNTMIGAEGSGISMGQKQRVLIARAVYRDPGFIFLDEATNSLDANNESVIVQNLQRFLQGKTVVVVAHRLSTVKQADQIIVLNKGIIAERGTHQELVNRKGEYFTLVRNQLELGE